jgi:hypothetical protein
MLDGEVCDRRMPAASADPSGCVVDVCDLHLAFVSLDTAFRRFGFSQPTFDRRAENELRMLAASLETGVFPC